MIRTLDIPRDPHAPGRARQVVDELAHVLDGELGEEMRLLVTELVTNSVRHGEGDEIRLVIDVRDRAHVRCEVIDAGSGFVPQARTRPVTEPGGWGLTMVERLSAAWGVREGSTHVWFELRR